MSPKLGRRVVVALVAVFVAVAFDRLTTAAPATQPTGEQAIDALAARNAELQKQVDDLKTQLKQKDLLIKRLEQRLAVGPQATPLQPFGLPMVPVPTPQMPSLRSPAVPPDMPPGSVPQRFNGSTFYVVPLEGQTVREGTLTFQGSNWQSTGNGTITVTPGSIRNVEIEKSSGPARTITIPSRPHQGLIDDRPASAPASGTAPTK